MDESVGGSKLETTEDNTSAVVQQIKELKDTIEKNQHLAKVLEEEPKRVVIKSYIEGDPQDLYTVCNSMFNSLKPKKQGEKMRMFALTIMVEDISPKNG